MKKLIKALLGILNTKSVFEMLEWVWNAGNRNMKLMANMRSIWKMSCYHRHLVLQACTKNDPQPSVNQPPPQEVMRWLQPPHTSRQYTCLSRWGLLPQSPRLKLLPALARVRVWPLEGYHSLGSVEVARNRLLAPEQGETGPPPEDLESEEGLPVKTQWMTSWTSYPQVGEGT